MDGATNLSRDGMTISIVSSGDDNHHAPLRITLYFAIFPLDDAMSPTIWAH